MANLPNFDYLLKTVFLTNDDIEQFAEDDILHQIFEKDNRWVTNVGAGQGDTTNTPAAYGMQWPIEDIRNTGWGAFSLQTPALVPPNVRQGAQAYTNLAATSIGLILDAFVFEAAKKDMQVFQNVVSRNMKTIFEDNKNQEARVMWGNGNGVLGTVSAINTGTGVVTIAPNVAGNFTPLTKFLQVGQLVTFLAPAGTSRSMAGTTITAMSISNGTITIATGGNIANIQVGDVIVNYQSWVGGSSVGQEPMGLSGIHGSSSNLFWVAVATHPLWVPAYTSSNNNDPSDAFLEYVRSQIALGGKQADICISHPLVVSKWGQGQMTYKRVLGTKSDFEVAGGIKTYESTQEVKGPNSLALALSSGQQHPCWFASWCLLSLDGP